MLGAMAPSVDFGARVGLALLVALALVLLGARKKRARFEPLVYALAAVSGAAAFFSFGTDYHWWNRDYVNRWDQFHLQLGSKYFPELGYDGLYAASLLAQQEVAPQLPVPAQVRDLASYKLVAPANQSEALRSVRERFSDARWERFLADHADYLAHTPQRVWKPMRTDHGYNSTPAWTFVARLFGARLPVGDATLRALAALDLALVLAMFAMLFRTYGYRPACTALAIFGLGYGWYDIYLGSLLRLDWLAATAIGICLLQRERFASAGACFGYAALARVFPVLFLSGPALLAAKALLRGERPRWALRVAAGFALAVCLGLAAGSATGRGVGAWVEFVDHIGVYRASWSADLVGLDTLFLDAPPALFAKLDGGAERRTQQGVRRALAERRAARIAAVTALLALVGLAMWRSPPDEAAVLGLVPIFALTTPASYYWIALALVPLRRGRAAAVALLLLAAAMHAIERSDFSPDLAPWRYGLLAWGYALILTAWLLPDLVRAINAVTARSRSRAAA